MMLGNIVVNPIRLRVNDMTPQLIETLRLRQHNAHLIVVNPLAVTALSK
jgi:hypothetical protein